jgi:hypothetical protein
MQIVTNESLVKRNARIGQIASIGGLGILVVGMIISFTRADLFIWSLLALLLGFTLSQVGIYFGNRWGRRPRPDEHLDAALKGLDQNYTLYHYTTPTAHLLVGPAGLWVLLPRQQRGTIIFEKGRWRQKGGGLIQAYMRFFAQEGIGRPDLEAQTEIESVHKFLSSQMDEDEVPDINVILVCTNDNATIVESEEATMPAIPVKKLKDFIRKTAKGKPISLVVSKTIQDAFATSS